MKKTAKTDKRKKVKGFQVRENECIWMKAGVINFRICDNAYDCNSCLFDASMQRAMKAKNTRREKWSDALMKTHGGETRPCRHVLTGRIDPPKLCTNNYECNHCEFDQWIEETDLINAGGPLYKEALGYRIAEDYYYHMGHGWARVEHGGYVRVGFDDFAVKLFGRAHSVNIPGLGARLDQHQPGWRFARDDLEADMLSPVTGTVIAVNHRAVDHPDIIHDSPYNEGWLFLVDPGALKNNLKKLYFGDEAISWVEDESRKLMNLMGPEYEDLSSTGGGPLDDFYGHYPDIGWDTLVRSFLRT